ncbi:MAG: ankyrin repeat domain-containing protein [Gammaproteobacteria bacterium]
MKTKLTAAIALLSLTLGAGAVAQETLIDLVKAGQRDAVLAAITSPDVDVNVTAPDGSTALMWATYQVDHELVNALLERGAKVDVTSTYGSTALTEAVKLSDVELVRTLLDAGADPDSPNQDNQTALMLAAQLGSLEIAQLLIDAGANVRAIETFRNQNALMWAAANNHPDIVDLLLEHGAGADVAMRARSDDWERQMTSEPRAQFRNTGGLTALLYATRAGCYRCAVALVEAGADVDQPNPDGVTPLINALDNRAFDIAMYLLDKGARPDVWDMSGRTPLYLAIDMNSFTPRGGFGGGGAGVNFGGVGGSALGFQASSANQVAIRPLDVAKRLLDMGVDPNHELTRMRPNGPSRGRFADYMMRGGTSALLTAALSYDADAMQLLLEHGAEVDLPNVFQITPLMAVAGLSGTGRPNNNLQGDVQPKVIAALDVLLAHGADINAQITDSHTKTATLVAYVQGRDQEGRTALFGAAEQGWVSVVEHLLAKGADPAIKDATGMTALDAALVPPRPAGGGAPPPSAEGRLQAAKLIADAMGVAMPAPAPAEAVQAAQ